MKQKQPKFITIEGIEGVGKSTCVAFIEECLTLHELDFIMTREPGGTPVAEDIRQILLHIHEETLAADAELLLMFAARAQHIATLVNPALAAGKWVVSDRFTDASFAYQGGGRGIPSERIAVLESWVQAELRPDMTILLDAPVDIALERAKLRSSPDRIESETHVFFERVRQAYLARAEQDPDRFRVVDATQALTVVQTEIKQLIERLF